MLGMRSCGWGWLVAGIRMHAAASGSGGKLQVPPARARDARLLRCILILSTPNHQPQQTSRTDPLVGPPFSVEASAAMRVLIDRRVQLETGACFREDI